MARYSKYTNVDANSAHQRFASCVPNIKREMPFLRQTARDSRDESREVKQTHQLLSITVGPPGQQTMGSMC